MHSKGFSDETLDAVSRHGTAEDFRCDRKTQARVPILIVHHRHREEIVWKTPAFRPYCLELRRQRQALARFEPQRADYGQSRLRPFARRRASRRRPLLVAMRARKPCVRLRCRLLGLKVRFMTIGPKKEVRKQ